MPIYTLPKQNFQLFILFNVFSTKIKINAPSGHKKKNLINI